MMSEIALTINQLSRNLWRATLDLWRFSPGFIVAYGLASTVTVLGSVGSAYLFGKGIDTLVNAASANNSAKDVYLLVGGSLILGMVEQLGFQVNNIIERRSYLRYQARLEAVINAKLSSLNMERYEDQDTNALITRVATDASWKPGNFAYRIFSLLQALVRLIAPGIVLVQLAPWMLPLLVAGALPSIVTEFRLSKIHWGFWQEDGDTNTLHWKLGVLIRDKESLKEIKLFGIVEYLARQISDLTNIIAMKQDKAIKKFTSATIISRLAETSVVLGLTIWLIRQVVAAPAALTVGGFSFYSGMLSRFSNATGLVASIISDLLTYNLYMSDYYKLMDMPNLLLKPENPVTLDAKSIPTIEFKHVTFGYKNSTHPVLSDFSIKIEAGEHLALVGENGAGKTTIIKLLMRLYDPDEGEILVNGHNLIGIDLASWYEHIGVLFQDFNRYPFDIQKNIRLGRIEQNEHHINIAKAIKLADLEKNVSKLPFHEKTILDSAFTDGVQPSGGQWQRVALARAFYRDANVLVLDEPTAAIDAKAEYEIFNNIFDHYQNKTALIISHRFSTVRKATRIVVLNMGKIEEEGSHKQLMKRRGLYAEMFEKQAEGYR
jgi:ATP-binding cassette, subfamily B, bacterial